jgi:hypothetical protein
MPEWMTLPEELDLKLAVFVLLVGIILSLSYFGQKDGPPVKASGRRIKHPNSVVAANGGASRAAAGTTGSDS